MILRLLFSAFAIIFSVNGALGQTPRFSIAGQLKDSRDGLVLVKRTESDKNNYWIDRSVVHVIDLRTGASKLRISSDDVLTLWPLLANDNDMVSSLRRSFGDSARFSGPDLLIGSPGFRWICDCGAGAVPDPGAPGKVFRFDGLTGSGKAAQIGSPLFSLDIGFGSSLEVSGETVFAGRTGLSTSTLSEVVRLELQPRITDPTQANDDFTGTVETNGEIVLVQRYVNRFTNAGDVGVYDAQTGEFLHTFTPNLSRPLDYFGSSISSTNQLAIIGAPGWQNHRTVDDGRAYLFDIETGRQLMEFSAEYDASNSEQNPNNNRKRGNRFGHAVAINSRHVLIGAPSESSVGQFTGAAYLYDIVDGKLLHTFEPPVGGSLGGFGMEVALSNGLALIGNGKTVFTYPVPEPTSLVIALGLLGGLVSGRCWRRFGLPTTGRMCRSRR